MSEEEHTLFFTNRTKPDDQHALPGEPRARTLARAELRRVDNFPEELGLGPRRAGRDGLPRKRGDLRRVVQPAVAEDDVPGLEAEGRRGRARGRGGGRAPVSVAAHRPRPDAPAVPPPDEQEGEPSLPPGEAAAAAAAAAGEAEEGVAARGSTAVASTPPRKSIRWILAWKSR